MSEDDLAAKLFREAHPDSLDFNRQPEETQDLYRRLARRALKELC